MHKLTPLWCMLPESGLNWRARLMKPSHEMYFVFTVTSTACSSSRTRFLPGLCSLYYHSHVSSQLFVHCTIIHTFSPGLYSLYYHSHIIPYVFIHCNITHTFPPMSVFTVLSLTPFPLRFIHCAIIHTLPMSTFSFTVHEIQQVCRIFTNHKIHKVFLQQAGFLSSPKHTLYTAISSSMSVCPTGWQYIYISSNSWMTLLINPCPQNEVKG